MEADDALREFRMNLSLVRPPERATPSEYPEYVGRRSKLAENQSGFKATNHPNARIVTRQ